MNPETLINLIWLAIFLLLAITCLVGVILGAWWHLITFGMCALMANVIYNDSENGKESVADFFKRIKSK